MKRIKELIRDLNFSDKSYKDKLNLLTKMINYPEVGHICENHLIKFCTENKLKLENHCEDGTSWWTVKAD